MKKIYKAFCRVEEVIVGICFASIVALIFIAALFRQLDMPLVWADDIAKLLFAWAAFLGADVAMRYSRLVGVDILVNKLPKKVAKLTRIFVFAIVIALLCAFVYYGIKLSIESVDRDFQTLSNFSYSYVTAALPVSSFFMIITALRQIGMIIKNYKNDEYNVLKDNPDDDGEEDKIEQACL